MPDEFHLHTAEDELAQLLSQREQRHLLLDHWLEQLDPQGDRGDVVAPMRASDGSIPGWMRPPGLPSSYLWQQMRGFADAVKVTVAKVQGREVADELLALVPSGASEVLGIATGPWRYVGITRVGGELELWFSSDGDVGLAGREGAIPGAWEIGTLRVPLTSALLREHVFDRIEWRNRPAFVVE